MTAQSVPVSVIAPPAPELSSFSKFLIGKITAVDLFLQALIATYVGVPIAKLAKAWAESMSHLAVATQAMRVVSTELRAALAPWVPSKALGAMRTALAKYSAVATSHLVKCLAIAGIWAVRAAKRTFVAGIEARAYVHAHNWTLPVPILSLPVIDLPALPAINNIPALTLPRPIRDTKALLRQIGILV